MEKNNKTSLRVATIGFALEEGLFSHISNLFSQEWECEQLSSELQNLQKELIKEEPDILLCTGNLFYSIKELLKEYSKSYLILALQEGEENTFLQDLEDTLVNDFILLPIRPLELVSHLNLFYERKEKESIFYLNQNLKEICEDMEKSIIIAQKIQLSCMKDNFVNLKNLSIRTRYWAGLSSGGNYFDIFQLPNKNHICFLMADMSTNALSNAFLRSIIAVPNTLGTQCMKKPSEVFRYIFPNIKDYFSNLSDKCSLFYAVLDLKTYVMEYICSGDLHFIHQRDTELRCLSKSEEALSKESIFLDRNFKEKELVLEPSDRFCLFSEGIKKLASKSLPKLLKDMRDEDAQLIINELALGFSKKVSSEEEKVIDFDKDCSLLFVNLAKNILRLAR